MEVVELAHLAGAELIIESGPLVEAAELELAADVGQHLVEVVAVGPAQLIELGPGGPRQHDLDAAGRGPIVGHFRLSFTAR